MEINFVGVIIATVLEFIIGAVWYGPICGKMWMKIHDCDKMSKEELKKMQKEMGPYYGVQLIATLVTTIILALFMVNLPQFSAFKLAIFVWLGFVVPTQVSAIIFGRDEKKWLVKKVSIMAGGALACILAAAIVLSMFK